MVEVFVGATGERVEDFHHFIGKWTRRNHAILRALQLCSGNHLHSLSYLLRVLDRLDTAANVEKIRHGNSAITVGDCKRDEAPAHATAGSDAESPTGSRALAWDAAPSCLSFQSSLKSRSACWRSDVISSVSDFFSPMLCNRPG